MRGFACLAGDPRTRTSAASERNGAERMRALRADVLHHENRLTFCFRFRTGSCTFPCAPTAAKPAARPPIAFHAAGRARGSWSAEMDGLAVDNSDVQGGKSGRAARARPWRHSARGAIGAVVACGCALLLTTAAAKAQFGAQPLGTASGSQGVTVTATAAGGVSGVKVLTWGAANGEFIVGGGASTCGTKTFSGPGDACVQSVLFRPAAPGPRLGAVVLLGQVNGVTAVLGTAYLSGTGAGGLGVLVAGNTIPVAGQLGLYTGVGDGGQATLADLYLPGAAAMDGAGNLYIADSGHQRVRMVCGTATTPTIQGTSCAGAGIISTIAGNGAPGYGGDGGPAADAAVNDPGYVALDGAGNLFIADIGNNAIRRIDAATGAIATVAGNPGGQLCASPGDAVGDGCPAVLSRLNQPQGVTLDGSGNLYIADTGNNLVRVVNSATGTITALAGNASGTVCNGASDPVGDGCPADSAVLNHPFAVAFDASGNLYIPDAGNNRVRKVVATAGAVTPSSNIVTFAGNGTTGFTSCTATPADAVTATVWSPSGVAVDAAGNVYIAETQNGAIRKVNAISGLISTLVQNTCGSFYFNQQFMAQTLYGPTGLYLDGRGNLYIADTLDMVVQEVTGNSAVLDFPTPVRQTEVSATQTQMVENDGNAALDLAAIAAGVNAQADATVADSCSGGELLAVDADCAVGAVFAPAATTPALGGNTAETPVIDVTTDTPGGIATPGSPLAIELVGTAAPISSTTTTVVSSLDPAGFGQGVTFTVTVNAAPGTGSLTGTVSISDSFSGSTTTLVSGLPLNAAGTAAFTLSTLAVGVHSITAAYDRSSDPAHMASTSAPALVETVLEGTAINLTSSSNPSTVGQGVTFTATVGSSGGGVPPAGTVTFFDGAIALGTPTLSAAGVAAFTTTALADGIHQITAVYNGSSGAQIEGSTSPAMNQDVLAPSSIAVASSQNPSNYGMTVVFTATVSSSATSAATGRVNFFDGGVAIGSGALSGSPGRATLTVSALAAGTHSITASYAGDSLNTGAASAAPLSQVSRQAPTVTTISAAPSPGAAQSPETLSATVALASGTAPLTGLVQFSSGTTALGSAPLNSSGAAVITATLAAGPYQIVATYAGDANGLGSASAPLSYAVSPGATQTALSVTPSPAAVFSPITFTAKVTGAGAAATGSVNFLANGVVIGTSPLSGGTAIFTDSSLAKGSYSFAAEYLGSTVNAASTSAAVSDSIGLISTVTSVGAASSSGANPQVILVATVVNGSPGPTPTGTVTFYNGATVLGTTALDASGVATITPNLPGGASVNISSAYGGDSNHGPSTSQITAVSGTAAAFTVSVAPSAVSMAASQNATLTVTLTSSGNFTDTIGLGCASLPAVVNCHFAAVSLRVPAGGTVTTQLTIDTDNPLGGGSSAMGRSPGSGRLLLGGAFLPLALGFGCVLRRGRRRGAGVNAIAMLLVLIAAAIAVLGCSSISMASATPGTYVIQVTGTGTSSELIQYQNVTLNITK